MAPWADALFANDRIWLEKYMDELSLNFKGDKFTTSTPPRGVTQVNINCLNNSGMGCIALAIEGGAEKVIMLGYDCQLTDGKAHWHGDHPAGLGNAVGVKSWPQAFWMFSEMHEGANIINASRQTALEVFPRESLESCLS